MESVIKCCLNKPELPHITTVSSVPGPEELGCWPSPVATVQWQVRGGVSQSQIEEIHLCFNQATALDIKGDV